MAGPIEWWAGNPSKAQTLKLASILVMVVVSGDKASFHPALSTISIVDDDVVLHGVVVVAGVLARVAQNRGDATRALGRDIAGRNPHGHFQDHGGAAVAGRALGANDNDLMPPAATPSTVNLPIRHSAVSLRM